jgi:phosphopantothenoylcysteine decarboxylase/phosphopantothenate--cysteine ligase, prokaryotic
MPSILLIIGGGIAAYKSLDLIRRAKDRGIDSRVIITEAGTQFVTPMTVSALSGHKAHTDMFDLGSESEMGHIQLTRVVDLVVVAPATANLIAQAANGLASDFASTSLLATDKPVLMAPAMNVRMWQHVATQRNVARLREDGVHFIGPNDGAMACNEYGPGRMAEPLEILDAIEALISGPKPLKGMKALVTAGPTHEPLDPVRFLGNRSSGKQGYAIAAALAKAGAETTLISGPVALDPPAGVKLVKIETARDMLTATEAALPADIAVFTAAVADWRPEEFATGKIKKTAGAPSAIRLATNPDILATISHSDRRPRLVIGFAAETNDVVVQATQKRTNKGCDWIVANEVGGAVADGVFGADRNKVHIIDAAGHEEWPEMDKHEIASRLVARMIKTLEHA